MVSLFIALAYHIGKRERDLLIAFDREKSALLAEALTGALREAMLEKDPAVFKRILDKSDSFGNIRIAILRPDGSWFYGNQQLSIPQEILSRSEETSVERDNSLLFFKPLINEERCHKCHLSGERIRGFVVTSVSTDRVIREIGETEKRIFLFFLLITLISIAVLVTVFKSIILDPLRSLENGARRIRDGDFSVRLNPQRRDEFSTLAITFNEMVEKIEGAQKSLENAIILKTKELEEQRDFSEAIFNNVVSGIIVLDATGTILRINRAGAEILQIPYESAPGLRLIDIYPECKEMLSIRSDLNREINITLKGGEIRPLGFANSLLLDKNGIERGIIVIFRDLTEVKKLQADLRNKHRFEAMGRVISGVAHEIRNPIFAIQSIAQILEKETETSRHQPLIQAMLKETKRIKNLVEELLLYSRPSRLNIRELTLKELVEELKVYALTKKREITFLSDKEIRVKADKDKLIQVFLNIIDNASGAGCSKIEIAAEEKDGKIRISISDDGEGVKEEYMDRVFEPFFTTKKDGTGLGLAICRKIIEDHGGNIEIRSKEGEGTTVILSLLSDLS